MTEILGRITNLNYARITKKIVAFLKDELRSSGREGYVFGLSGGLDSAVVAALASEALREKVYAYILPHSHITPESDLDDALHLAKQLGIRSQMIDLDDIHVGMTRKFVFDRLAAGNLLARLRMCLLYYHANQNNCLVMGTSDRSELMIGYFTKFGDGAADVLPLGSLYKLQVRHLGSHLKIPEKILRKKSSPMLWEKHTAEEEVGMTYEEIDGILYCLFDLKLSVAKTVRKLGVEEGKVRQIKEMRRRAMHKRSLPKICPALSRSQ